MEASVDAAIEALARTQHGAFSRSQAFDRGATNSLVARRTAAGRWIRVAPGIYVLAGWPPSFEQRLVIACLGPRTWAYASHRAAAVVCGLDGVFDAPVEISVPSGTHYTRRGVVVHRTKAMLEEDRSVVRGIPTTSATRTIVDLASVCSLDVVERAYESAVRRGLTSLERVEQAVERLSASGRPGIAKARQLLNVLVRDGVKNGSDLETRFLQLIRAEGLSLPIRQRQVFRPDGSLAFADYAYDELRVMIELEGFDSHSTRLQHRRDIERNNHLVLQGWAVLRFNWGHVTRDPDYVIRSVMEAIGALLV